MLSKSMFILMFVSKIYVHLLTNYPYLAIKKNTSYLYLFLLKYYIKTSVTLDYNNLVKPIGWLTSCARPSMLLTNLCIYHHHE